MGWLFSCYKARSLILNFLLFVSQCIAFQEACHGQVSSMTWALALHLYNVFNSSSKSPSTSKHKDPFLCIQKSSFYHCSFKVKTVAWIHVLSSLTKVTYAIHL